MTGGHLLAACLVEQGVERIFCVPGESHLALLDGLHGGPIDIVNARHEGAAAMMAEADGKLTGRPGVVLVTRGPGATNAACGVHVAQQDSTPLLLLVGQIGRGMGGRDAFQEVDYRALFGGMAKWVEEVRDADRLPEIVSHAMHVAMSGRPGPVVLALPEDMLRDETSAVPGRRVDVDGPLCASSQAQDVARRLAAAERPMLLVGGSRWDADGLTGLDALLETWALPAAVTFRRQGVVPADQPCYAGDLGLGANPALVRRVAEADLVLLVGGRLSENPSQGFTLLAIPEPRQTLIHVHPGPEELGRIYRPTLGICAVPGSFCAALADNRPPDEFRARFAALASAAHADYRAWSEAPPAGVGAVTMSQVIRHMRDTLPADATITNGAGNYAIWAHRFLRYGRGTQVAPTSGSMGYGLPAAIAAALRHPDREIVCLAGDGCFQMTSAELATAVERKCRIRILVCDNGQYGTIRMHQARDYPGRPTATALRNPDFAALATAHGAAGFPVARDADFPSVLAEARAVNGPALIHLRLDARDIAPGRVLDA